MDFKLPPIARGEVLPNSFGKAKQEEELRKRQLRQNILITVISTIAGAILSNIDRIYHFIAQLLSQQ